MRRTTTIILVILVVLFIVAVVPSFLHSTAPTSDNVNFILTAISATATLGGIAFALYGWYTANEIPKLVEKQVEEKTKEIFEMLNKDLYKQQQAMQKLMTAYSINDPSRKTEKLNLIKSVVETYPQIYNGYVTLAYEYWYAHRDFVSAADAFMKDLEYHPENYQAANDLAALYAAQGEYVSALSWMKKTLEMNPKTWADFEQDSRFDSLRTAHRQQYDKLIDAAKVRSN